MKHPHGSGFTERQKSSVDAKKDLLSKFKAAAETTDPAVLAKREERARIVAARNARKAEKDRIKAEEKARLKAEADAKKAAEEAIRAEKERTRLEAEAAQRKASEDRKAKQYQMISQVLSGTANYKAQRNNRQTG